MIYLSNPSQVELFTLTCALFAVFGLMGLLIFSLFEDSPESRGPHD